MENINQAQFPIYISHGNMLDPEEKWGNTFIGTHHNT